MIIKQQQWKQSDTLDKIKLKSNKFHLLIKQNINIIYWQTGAQSII